LALQSAIENHGAIESSNQWVTSFPGVFTVGSAFGSRGSRSIHVMSLPEPARLERNRMIGSSWPMYRPLSWNRVGFPS
jgi:hypothetical protein